MTEYEQSVFISYAWGSERESVVNEIDESLQQRGIRIIRDKRALGYKGSIKEFMERIGRGSCIIVVISDKYLRSSNCMFELVEIAENKQFHDRVFPVVLNDANIYDPVKRIEYVKHWEAKRKELAKAMKGVDPANLHGIREEMDTYDRIRDRISGITSILKDMNTLTPDMHRDSEFSNLYDAIVARLKEGATDVTSEFDELAQRADAERKAQEEREAKATADRLAVQKAEAERKAKEETDRLAAQRAEAERVFQQRAEEERLAKAKTEADRLAAQHAEEERVAKAKAETERTAKEDVISAEVEAAPIQKKRTSNVMMYGIAAVVLLTVLGIGLYGLARANKNSVQLVAPTLISPVDQSTFDYYPRTTKLQWASVDSAIKYFVEVQYCRTGNTDCSPLEIVETDQLSHTFDFTGAQPGRWRVWAVDINGQEGPKSDWWYFTYTQ